MNLHPLSCARPAHHLCLAGELDKMVALSFNGRENREGHGGAPRAAAPSSARSFPRPITPWSSSSSSSSSSRPPSSCSRWRRAPAVRQAALHLWVLARPRDFLHVLPPVDEPAAFVIVMPACDSLCVTTGLSLCGRPVCIRDVVRVKI